MGSRKLSEKELSDRRRMVKGMLAKFNGSPLETEFSRDELFGPGQSSAIRSWSGKIMRLLQNQGFVKRSGTFGSTVYSTSQIIPMKEELIAICVSPPTRLYINAERKTNTQDIDDNKTDTPDANHDPAFDEDSGFEEEEPSGVEPSNDEPSDAEPEVSVAPPVIDEDADVVAVVLQTLQATFEGVMRIEERTKTLDNRLMALEGNIESLENKVERIYDEWTGQTEKS